MGGFFNFLTTIATNGRGRPFNTFLALTSHYSRKSMKTLEELTPGGCRWPVADLCTLATCPKRRPLMRLIWAVRSRINR
jgi:hypothetical protein